MKRSCAVVGGLSLTLLLSSCFPTPTPDPSLNISFSLPIDDTSSPSSSADATGLKIAAVYYMKNSKGEAVLKMLNAYGGAWGKSGSISISQKELDAIDKTTCLPYYFHVTRQSASVNPADGQSCDIIFMAYTPVGRDDLPTTATVKYLTHDTYSYANKDYTYSAQASEGGLTATESGTRKAGWTLVKHLVINPASNPSSFIVTRDSVDKSLLNLPLRLHEPTNMLTSMSLGSAPTGGLK